MTTPDRPVPDRPVRFRTSGLSPRKPTHFTFQPDQTGRDALARSLGLIALYDLRFTGSITPAGRDTFVLSGDLSASVAQACVVTLAPVPAKITEVVTRRYVADLDTPQAEEMEIPEDDSLEPMPEVIDLADLASEALALALPLYPRAPDAALAPTSAAPEGAAPLTDDDLKPFAGLAGLAAKLAENPPEDGSSGT